MPSGITTRQILKFGNPGGAEMKAVAPKPMPRHFHQASWDEPVIFELSQPGARGILVPQVEAGISQEVGDVTATLPDTLRRKAPPALPEMSQVHVLRHYARLSQENLGVDLNIDVGQGTCTMKYSLDK
jgi:glycine dehydrogenase subunit 2